MNIFCAGINHRLASVELREQLAIADRDAPAFLAELLTAQGTTGAVVLSTCNRVEIYTASICPAHASHKLRELLSQRCPKPFPLYEFHTPASIRHLYRVASGLDSMVIGETEILGQVKKAYSLAAEAGTLCRPLHKLFQNAFHVAKSVRSETLITRGPTSVGAAAVELAHQIFGNLNGKRILILGAGETAERTARALLQRGARSIIVSNRSFDRAAKLAHEIGGLAIHFDNWQNVFEDVDILICSTSAPHTLITPAHIQPLMPRRPHRPLFVIDLAVPRDADPAINSLDGVFLYDIDSLQTIVNESLEIRRSEVARCESLIESEVRNYLRWLTSHAEFRSSPPTFSSKKEDKIQKSLPHPSSLQPANPSTQTP